MGIQPSDPSGFLDQESDRITSDDRSRSDPLSDLKTWVLYTNYLFIYNQIQFIFMIYLIKQIFQFNNFSFHLLVRMMLILRYSNIVYAMHLPKRLFLNR
jgi:hypothetical protein